MTHKHNDSQSEQNKPCHNRTISEKNYDFLLWGTIIIVALCYFAYMLFPKSVSSVEVFFILSKSVFELMNTIWWGIFLGMIMVGVLAHIPREFVISIFGRPGGISGILRSALGGFMLDLCSHGILMVGAKLYERGASIGQVMAFLIASPWNSFSLTLILVALVGIYWTLTFIFLSMAIAIISGMIFEYLTKKNIIKPNPNKIDLPDNFNFWPEAKARLKKTDFTIGFLGNMFWTGVKDSRMVVRWILFGVILTGLIRAFVDAGSFETFFGPTLAGLGLTVIVATVLEVCSEGSTPVAADLLTRAKAPGNSFAFLMTGVATDYTEIMVLKETTKSWKPSLFLPLITVPQVLVISYIINITSSG